MAREDAGRIWLERARWSTGGQATSGTRPVGAWMATSPGCGCRDTERSVAPGGLGDENGSCRIATSPRSGKVCTEMCDSAIITNPLIPQSSGVTPTYRVTIGGMIFVMLIRPGKVSSNSYNAGRSCSLFKSPPRPSSTRCICLPPSSGGDFVAPRR